MSFLNWLHRLRGHKPSLGVRGERLAARFLKQRGYRILERNLEVHDDEADLLALDPDGSTIVIVEVKTRRDDRLAPEAAVNRRKQEYLTRLAMKLQQRAAYRDRAFRFDVVAVVVPERGEPAIRHIPGAFQAR